MRVSRKVLVGLGVLSCFVIVGAFTFGRPPVSPVSTSPINESSAPAMYIEPVQGLTIGRHLAPHSFAVPVGTTVYMFQEAQLDDEVTWVGATEVARRSNGSLAVCPFRTVGTFSMRAELLMATGVRYTNACNVNVLPIPINAITVQSVIPSVAPLGVDDPDLSQQELNDLTVALYHGDSIAAFTEVTDAAPWPPRPANIPRYRTSIDRPINLQVTVDPPQMLGLMEWRVEGQAKALGAMNVANIKTVGVHSLEVGPPGRPGRLEVETYEVIITSHAPGDIVPEGVPITYEAVTNPPGYEDEITWLAATKYGTGIPVLGYGPTFTTQFDDTYGPHSDWLLWQWLGVRADNDVRGQDQKPDGISVGDCNGNGMPDNEEIINNINTDANGNGLPDDCDSDCNENGIPDFEDILLMTSDDCDLNNVPDECQVAAAPPVKRKVWILKKIFPPPTFIVTPEPFEKIDAGDSINYCNVSGINAMISWNGAPAIPLPNGASVNFPGTNGADGAVITPAGGRGIDETPSNETADAPPPC